MRKLGYRQTSNISRAIVDNEIVDSSDVVEESSLGAAPTTSSFLTLHLASMDWALTTARRDEKHLGFRICCVLYWRLGNDIMAADAQAPIVPRP